MHWGWNNVDFSPYARLRHRRWLTSLLDHAGFLSQTRRERLALVDPEVVAWNLSRGVPFADSSFDVVYHSHVLEHFPKNAAAPFLRECRRVLKPTGRIRVVVPDLEQIVALYIEALTETAADADLQRDQAYDQALFELFEQMTNDRVVGTEQQRPWVRAIEGMVRRDASQVGQRHRWAYDEFSMARLLTASGFIDPARFDAGTSRISCWSEFNLDTEADGQPYKGLSLYMEAVRP
jgi:SAM-dependent methyltransferase